MNEAQLHQLIRQSFEGKNRARLAFTLVEVSHAWVNVFVERLESSNAWIWWSNYKGYNIRIGHKSSYVLGHIAAWLAAGIVLAAVGSVAGAVLIGIGRVIGG